MQRNIFLQLNWRTATTFVAAMLLSVVFFSHAARAESQITLSPTSQHIKIAPGKTHEGVFTVINSGNAPLDVRIYVAPYQVQNEKYDPIFSKETPRTQISRWVSFERNTYSLKPNEQVEVPYKINTPQSIPDGGQYAAIFAETNEEPDGSSIAKKKRVGVILYARPDGKTVESGKVEFTNISNLQIVTGLTFNQRIINEGNTDLSAQSNVTVKSLGGKELFTDSQQKIVLPDTTRAVPTEWKNTPHFGITTVSQKTTLAGKEFADERTVIIISPILIIILGGAIILIVGGGIYGARRSKSKRRHASRNTR